MDDDEFEIELPPPDIVPHNKITPAVADLLQAHVGEQVIVHWPGEAIEGPDGDLVAMTKARTVTAALARLHIPTRRTEMTTEPIDDTTTVEGESLHPEEVSEEEPLRPEEDDTNPNGEAAKWRTKLPESEAVNAEPQWGPRICLRQPWRQALNPVSRRLQKAGRS